MLKSFNPLPKDKILDWFKWKAFADDKINVTKELKFTLERVENIVGKRRKRWLRAFSPFHTLLHVFESYIFSVVKSRDCMVMS